jgi:hypothetical protein
MIVSFYLLFKLKVAMKVIILPLLFASIGIAEAGVYKCPDPVTGKFTYQSRPCNNQARSEEQKVRIAPTDEKSAQAAKKKLDLYMKKRNGEDIIPATSLPVTAPKIKVTRPTQEESPVTNESTNISSEKKPSLAEEKSVSTPPINKSPTHNLKLDPQPSEPENLSNVGS